MDKPRRILVVDDDRAIRFLLSEALLREGFEVSLARDGVESLEKLEKDDFDLVITDINMPRLDGIEMLKSMKKTGRKEKIIVMTGNPSALRLSHGDMPPIVSKLPKPFKIDNLLDTVIAATAAMGLAQETENQYVATA